jgi:hypothetical protein
MDNIIPYNDIVEMLKNPPTLAPRPNFFRLQVFCRHIVDVEAELAGLYIMARKAVYIRIILKERGTSNCQHHYKPTIL